MNATLTARRGGLPALLAGMVLVAGAGAEVPPFDVYHGAPPAYVKPDGVVMVPARGLFEWLQTRIDIDEETGAVSFLRVVSNADGGPRTQLVRFKVGETKATLVDGNAEAQIVMESAAEEKDGRLFVPLSFVGEALELKVSYNENTHEAMIVQQTADARPGADPPADKRLAIEVPSPIESTCMELAWPTYQRRLGNADRYAYIGALHTIDPSEPVMEQNRDGDVGIFKFRAVTATRAVCDGYLHGEPSIRFQFEKVDGQWRLIQ